jgi:MtrB/PioB family decaheme-associated outer membrane protein
MDTHTRYNFPLAVALLMAFWATAQAADEEEIARLVKPESTVSLGAGFVNSDNQRFGQYNGLNQRGAYGLVDAEAVQRDDETGTWLKFSARNLGLDDRELRFEQQRQGDWGYSIDYSQIPRFNPLTVNTGLTGIGTPNLTLNGGPLQNVQLSTERKRTTFGFDKLLPGGFDFQLRLRNEDKDGARMYGQGTDNAPAAINFLADPIHQNTRQLDATLGYTGERLQLTGGYYGTWFDNQNTSLNITGTGVAPSVAVFSLMTLPPDNQSHQVYLSGGYGFTPTTRGTFKIAYTHQTQDDTFVVPSAGGQTNLGGRLDTTLLQAGLTSRPMPKLSLLANVRYEDRDDKTPVFVYFTGATATSTLDGTNEPRSLRSITGKLEASYVLPMGFRFTGGANYEVRQRNEIAVRSLGFRDETDEIAFRAELRRSISETVTGALAYIRSDRYGSPFLTNLRNGGTFGSNFIAPLYLANRVEDKVRLTTNWEATEKLSLQFVVDGARDAYNSRTAQELGMRSGKVENYSADAAYALSEKWQATAWYSRNDTHSQQADCVGAAIVGGVYVCPASAASPIWAAELSNVSDSFGIGLRGKLSGKLDVGANFQYSTIRDRYLLSALNPATAATGSTPDISTRLTNLKLFARYAVRKNMGVRFEYIRDQFKTDDWTWTNFLYSDGTTVIQNPNQTVNFFGMSVYFTWQ